MGCCGTKHQGESGGSHNSISAVLLGLSGSGKSTIRKQLQLIYAGDFSPQELETYKVLTVANVLQATQQILVYASNNNAAELPSDSEAAKKILEVQNVWEVQITPELREAIKEVWKNPKVEQLIPIALKEEMKPAANYFKGELNRILSEDYTPTHLDVLYCRQRTAGINTLDFEAADSNDSKGSKKRIHIVDGGGQPSERRKWNNYIDDNDTVLFCIGIDEYDIPCFDKNNQVTNLEFSLELLANTLVYANGQKKPVIVLLNKIDLLQQKLEKVPLNKYYPEFDGGSNFERAKEFLEKKVMNVAKASGVTNLYCYFTCALDRQLVKTVFDSVNHHIINTLIDNNFGFM
jgi:guanine nucleotide-binding protein G(i) subunit alpha